MTDYSVNDGHFKIGKGGCFSKSIVEELGLTAEEAKKIGSVWNKIFEIAKEENLGNLNIVQEGQEFQFSASGWKKIMGLVYTKLKKNPVTNNSPAPEQNSTSKKPLINNFQYFCQPESTAVTEKHFGIDLSQIEFTGKSWDEIKQQQDKINSLPSNKERVIEWNKSFNKNGKNYVIVDKENFTATVYSSDGKVVKEFEVGLGRMIGDANLKRSKKDPKNDLNYTTAGIYTANYKGNGTDAYSKLYNENILTLSNDALKKRGVGSGETGVALHQVPNGNSKRIESLKKDGKSTENNRISDGCVNFLPEEFEELMSYIDGVGTKVYILPEDDNNYMCVKNGELQFAQKEYTGDVPTTLALKDEIKSINISPNFDISEEGQKMAETLCKHKEELCKDLKIDNDTFNTLALLALGIAGQETNYGDSLAGLKKGTPYFLKEKCTGLFNFIKEDICGNKSYNSRGLTQMKIAGYTDETVKKLFEKYKISADNVQDGEKSAFATIIVLTSIYKNELPALKEQMSECNISTQDALLYCWNNKKNEITKGTATPDKNIYVKNVHNYMNDFNLTQFA